MREFMAHFVFGAAVAVMLSVPFVAIAYNAAAAQELIRTVYAEFAAVYLELRYFASSRLANYFPGIRDFDHVDQILARDVDAPALFVRTRLVDAPDPIVPADVRLDDSQEAYWRLVRTAERAALDGNVVRAAIL